MPETPVDAKRALRAELIAQRARVPQGERLRLAHAIAERLDDLPAFRQARTVALYAPLGTEADSTEIARRARDRGALVVYPRSVTGERRLEFCRCAPEDLVRGPLGASEPPGDLPPIDLDALECVVIPGVGFSLDGHRLGRGGGYYDATLATVPRARRIGVGFDLQLVPALPREPHDAPLDALVTDARALIFSRDPP